MRKYRRTRQRGCLVGRAQAFLPDSDKLGSMLFGADEPFPGHRTLRSVDDPRCGCEIEPQIPGMGDADVSV